MKYRIALLLALALLLCLTACCPEPEAACDLVYDISGDLSFSEIFDAQTEAEWDAMGCYTIALDGLSTPVTVEMEGRTVQSVRAYGHTVNVNIGVYQGDVPASIDSASGAVLVNESTDYDGSTWILTADGCFEFHPEGDISTQIFAREDGTLGYRRYWGEYVTTFEQWDAAPLDLCTSRDHFLYELGIAEIRGGSVVLTAVETVVVSDQYDLDALFSEAKSQGSYQEYETVDALFAANRKSQNAS